MAAFIASYAGPTGQPRTVTVKAADLAEAKKLLRRRGIRAEELRPVSPGNSQDTKADGADAGGLKSIDLNRMFEKAPGVKEKAVFASKLAALVDAGMNDLMRPALYDAWHEIVPVVPRSGPVRRYDVVGPVCESSDFLGRGRELALEAGDLLAVLSAGAYGMAMSSNYNARPRPAEVLVDGAAHRLIRARESLESLWALEA